jgi:protein SCO1/2
VSFRCGQEEKRNDMVNTKGMQMRRCLRAALELAVFILAPLAGTAVGQVLQTKPRELEGVGIDEQLNAQIPQDLDFRDSTGRALQLREIFAGQRPVLLSLNYSDCPMLCRVQLNGLVDALKEISWTPGAEFDVVSVSIDPLETTDRAKQTQSRYFKMYGRPVKSDGWRFLTGHKQAIAKLADAVGFRFKYIPERKEYAHAAALMICTPDGRVSRYLYGIVYDPKTLKLSLVEAGEGQIGTTLDQVLLFCFHYDAESGRYGPTARRIMQFGAGLTLVVLLGTLLPVWLRRRHRHAERL